MTAAPTASRYGPRVVNSSKHVELNVIVRVEVEDEAALRAAADAAGLPDSSDLASCVGMLAHVGRVADGIPGTRQAGSGLSAAYYEPDQSDDL